MAKPSCRPLPQQESVFATGLKGFFDSIGQFHPISTAARQQIEYVRN
jgi:hypothetical protein